MASCSIGSGTDGLATHHKAPLGALRPGGGGTEGGGNTTGGSNTVGLGTLPPLGDGFVPGGLVADPGGLGRTIGGFCIGSGEPGVEPSFGGVGVLGGFCIGSGEPGPIPPLGDGIVLGGLVIEPGGLGRTIGGFCIGSGELGPVPPLGDGMVLGGLVVDPGEPGMLPGGPGMIIGGFCKGEPMSGEFGILCGVGVGRDPVGPGGGNWRPIGGGGG